jgi:nucleotidyltransferase substrate binding protein (TIGR01987 family)
MNNLIFDSFQNSLLRFGEILVQEVTIANRDSAIKRFELTFELAWKVIKNYLSNEGIIVKSPKEAFSEAFKQGILEDDPIWIEIIQTRNLTVHTYDEETANQVYLKLGKYFDAFTDLQVALIFKLN